MANKHIEHLLCSISLAVKDIKIKTIMRYHVTHLRMEDATINIKCQGFPGGSDGKNLSAMQPSSIPGLGRSPGEGNGNPLQYSCLENPHGQRAWWATVHGVVKSWTRLKQPGIALHMAVCMFPRYPLSLSRLLLPTLCPQVCSLCLCL